MLEWTVIDVSSPKTTTVSRSLHVDCITNAIRTALNPPRIWRRYVDDTFVIQHQAHKEELFKHINTVDPSIQFTVEEAGPDGPIPFLDI